MAQHCGLTSCVSIVGSPLTGALATLVERSPNPRVCRQLLHCPLHSRFGKRRLSLDADRPPKALHLRKTTPKLHGCRAQAQYWILHNQWTGDCNASCRTTDLHSQELASASTGRHVPRLHVCILWPAIDRITVLHNFFYFKSRLIFVNNLVI